jgi:hypothetical protein
MAKGYAKLAPHPSEKGFSAKSRDLAHICVFGEAIKVDAQNSFGASLRNEYLGKVWLHKQKDASGGWVRYTSDVVPVL